MSRPNELWRLLTLPCDGMTRLASESLDRDLGRMERIALAAHLLYCSACRRSARQMTLLRAAMRRLSTRLASAEPFPGPGLPDDLRERLKQALRNR